MPISSTLRVESLPQIVLMHRLFLAFNFTTHANMAWVNALLRHTSYTKRSYFRKLAEQ